MSLDPIFAAAVELQQFCSARQWRFCFIGGIAVQRWGEPRFTADADITLITGFGREEEFINSLHAKFRSRRPDLKEFALRTRVVLLEASNGISLDIALGAVPFEINSVRRASAFSIGENYSLLTCSAEDLLVHKVIANREKDWIDVESVLSRRWGKLDLSLVRTELDPLLELREDPAILARFERLYSRLKRRLG